MGKPILHSELTKAFFDLTRNGVLAEGAAFDFSEVAKVPSQENIKTASNQSAAMQAKPAGFKLGAKSLRELEGVDGQLVEIVRRAINLTTQDFQVFDGLRTAEEQKALVAKGASRTMDSKHLKGLAVDLVPIIGGVLKWDWDGCAKIAFAVDQAATQLGLANKIRWGGAWDRTLADYGGELRLYMREVELYKSRHAGKDFIDGPHFELI